jgi:hypothetical protein
MEIKIPYFKSKTGLLKVSRLSFIGPDAADYYEAFSS